MNFSLIFTSNVFIPQVFTLLPRRAKKNRKTRQNQWEENFRLSAYESKILALVFSAPIQVISLFEVESVQKQTLIVLV